MELEKDEATHVVDKLFARANNLKFSSHVNTLLTSTQGKNDLPVQEILVSSPSAIDRLQDIDGTLTGGNGYKILPGQLREPITPRDNA